MVYFFAGIILFSAVVYLFFNRRIIAGGHYSRVGFCRICRGSGFSFRECAFLFQLFSRVSTTKPEAAFGSETMLLRIIDLFIEDVRVSHDLEERDRLLSRAFRLRHAVEAGLRSGRSGFRHTFALRPGIRFAMLANKSERVYPVTLVERQQGYLVCTRPEGREVERWIGMPVSVTFWIPGESGYRFCSEVLDEVIIDGESLIFLSHSSHLKRVQQRKFHRADCMIAASLLLQDNSQGLPAGSGTILDISAEGISLRSEASLDIGDKVGVVFDLEGQGECRPQARVLGHHEGRYSLQFVSAELADQNRILLYLHRPGS